MCVLREKKLNVYFVKNLSVFSDIIFEPIQQRDLFNAHNVPNLSKNQIASKDIFKLIQEKKLLSVCSV